MAYFWGLELISREQGSVPIYYVHDGHGSVRALTNSSGAVTDTYDYDAFGNLLHSTGTTTNSYLFAGEQFDPNLNLYYNRARYLATTTGRFWTMDTYEGDGNDPLSLHKYLYTQNDPIDGVDPSGNQDDIAAEASDTLDNMSSSSLFITRYTTAALPIPPYPPSRPGRQLVGAIYAESSTSSHGGGEYPDEKIAIGLTFIWEAYIAANYPTRWNRAQYGTGDLWTTIQRNSAAVGGSSWNEVMDGNTSMSDLKDSSTLNQQLRSVPSRIHFIDSIFAVDSLGGGSVGTPITLNLSELQGRMPVSFKSGSNPSNPNPNRQEVIGKIGGTTFYGFKPGREAQ